MTTSTDPAAENTRELSPLKRAYLALERMENRCRELERDLHEPIAVVGMACRLPGGAADPEAYWHLLRDGVDAVCEVPADRWDREALYDPDPGVPGTMCTRRGGFLREPVDAFDPQFFGISPREAETMDPQHRLLLEVAQEALERAAQVEDRLAGSRTGVFIGITSHDFADLHLAGQDLAALGPHLITGNTLNAAAGRLSYCFGFLGPCLAVDTACSSSLVAIHLAARSLARRECCRALAGGVNLILSPVPTIALSQGGVLAPDGVCRAFDAAAAGMVRGEGCAVVVLKRLEDALADGDTVLALIRNTAVNQDGPSSGLTVPNGPAQEALIRETLRGADLAPADIDYLEAHGTGTPLGDPIELQALANVFGGARDRPLLIGSVKTNLGHLEACSGVASLIKVVLSLHHAEIPPHLHLRNLTPHLPWHTLPFAVPTARQPWPRGAQPRRAGVSSFGFSGVNAHVVLEEAPALPVPAPTPAPALARPLHLLTLAGRSDAALRQTAARFAEHLRRHPDLDLADVGFSAGVGRGAAGHRLALTAATLAQARDGLDAFVDGRPWPELAQGVAETPPKVAFLFTGQGSQYAGMGQDLFATQPGFRRTLLRCEEILRPRLPHPLLEVLFAAPGAAARLDDTRYAQPALFALGYALAELWRSWGVQPAVVLGHSLGEYVAAAVAGVFDLEDALTLVADRARLIAELPREGEMLTVLADPERVTAALRPYAGDIAVAAYNAPEQIVVSGRTAAVRTLAAELAADGVSTQGLRVSHAFHSPLMEPILDAFEARVGQVALAAPKIALISNLAGGPASADLATPGYWRRHLRQPVRFAQGVAAARAKGCTLFLELGPKPTLLGLARQSLPDDGLAWLASLRHGQPSWRTLLDSLAAFYCRGGRIDWPGFERDYRRQRVVLPTTPFQRRRCWPEPPARGAVTLAGYRGRPAGHPLLGVRIEFAGLPERCFESRVGRASPAWLTDHRVFGETLLPAAAFLEMAVAAGAEAFGTAGACLEDVAFEKALVLPEHGVRTLQTLLRPDGTAAFRFEIHSRSDGDGEPWVRHAAGRLLPPGAAPALVQDPQALAAQAGAAVDLDAIYARCRARGVDLGPSFQALRRAWCRTDTAVAELGLPAALTGGAADYRLHPVLLDGAFQAMGAVFADQEQDAGEVYLPVTLDRLLVQGPGGTAGWSRVRVTPLGERQARSLKVDLELLSAAGRTVAVIEGLHLKRAERHQIQTAGGDTADWLYEVQWRAAAAVGPADFPADAVIAATILPGLAAAAAQEPHWARYDAFLTDIEAAAAGYVRTALGQLGWTPAPASHDPTSALAARLGVVERQRRLFGRLLEIQRETADRARPDPDVAALLEDYPPAAAELVLLRRCGERLAQVLRGECDPLTLLFPQDEPVTAASLYADSPGARVANAAVRGLFEALLEHLPPARRLRILELGAGTGGTTAQVLDLLPTGLTEYAYTDISPLFVRQAQERFRDFPGLRFGILNIEEPPAGQGYEPGGYDLVLAANVLHATTDLRRTLGHVRDLLAPGGLLVLLEGTVQLRFIDLIFGLLDSWWRFADTELRPTHPLLGAAQWRPLLAAAGLAPVGTLAEPRAAGGAWSTQALIVARAGPRQAAAGRDWLILAPAGSALGEALQRQVEARGDRALVIHPGRAAGAATGGRRTLDPGAAADFRSLVADLRESPPARIVHLWNTAPAPAAGYTPADLEEANRLGCETALQLVQSVMDRYPDHPPELWLVTRGAQPAGGTLDPAGVAGAPLWGFGKVATLEYPHLRCVRVDLEGADPQCDARDLCEEMLRESTEDQVAFRGGRRHLARLVHHRAAPGELRIRADGSYLITGGHRGLGLATARWLVERGARYLLLLGRGRAEEDPDTAAALAQLRRHGATVEAVTADVADAAQVGLALARLDAGWPPLRGLVHSAGVLDDGILAQQTAARFRRVLAPKALGAWHLHTLTLDRELDFFVLYSSLASLMGSAGQANYAAANAFLDTLAHYRRGLGRPALSINWGAWSDIGAAARLGVGERVRTLGMGTIAPGPGLRILGQLLAGDAAQVGVAPIDWPVFARQARVGRPPPLFAELARVQPAADPPGGRAAPGLRAALGAADAAEREARLADYLRRQVAAVLRLAPADLSPEQPLNRIGLDSLMAVELRNRLRAELGLDVPLVRFMQDLGVADLAAEWSPRLAPAPPAPPPAASAPPTPGRDPASASLLAQLDDLSDAEVDALLSAALAGESAPAPAEVRR